MLWSYFFLLFWSPAFSWTQNIFHIDSYGAVANDNKDDTDALRAALAHAMLHENAQLTFGPGQYDMQTSVRVTGQDNFSILGAGLNRTLLMFHTQTEAIYYLNNNNFTMSGFTIDYASWWFTAGYISSVSSASPWYYDIQIVAPHTADAGRNVAAMFAYDVDNHRPASGSDARECYQSGAASSLVSEGVLRVPINADCGFSKGQAVVVRWTNGPHVITGGNTNGVTLQDVLVLTGGSMAHASERDTDVNIVDFHVHRGDDRWLSTWADCLHLSDHSGLIAIVNSSCEHMGDDGLNIHSFYFTLSQIINNSAVQISLYKSWPDTLNISRGEILSFAHNATPFSPYGASRILQSKMLSDNTWEFVFDSINTNFQIGDFVWVSAPQPQVFISNFTVKSNRARGMLLEASNVLVERSLFSYNSGPSVLFQPSMYWGEAPPGANITIRSCMFDQPNQGIANQPGSISILPDPIQSEPCIYNITFSNNVFHQSAASQSLLLLANVNLFNFVDNFIDWEQSISMPVLQVCNSAKISVSHNALSAPGIPPLSACLGGRGCTQDCQSEISSSPDAITAQFKPPVCVDSSGYGVYPC